MSFAGGSVRTMSLQVALQRQVKAVGSALPGSHSATSSGSQSGGVPTSPPRHGCVPIFFTAGVGPVVGPVFLSRPRNRGMVTMFPVQVELAKQSAMERLIPFFSQGLRHARRQGYASRQGLSSGLCGDVKNKSSPCCMKEK